MTIWCLATYDEFLATSVFLTQYDAYEELIHQLYGEDAELPDPERESALLALLGPKTVLRNQPLLSKETISNIEDAAIDVGMEFTVDLHSYPLNFAKADSSGNPFPKTNSPSHN